MKPEPPSQAQGAVVLRVAGVTDIGLARTHNEDSLLIADLTSGARDLPAESAAMTVGPRGLLFAVCDGMGGTAAGEVASQMASDEVFEGMVDGDPPPDRERFATRLVESIQEAGARIYAASHRTLKRRGMGTTATVAGVFDRTLFVGQVGDSRAYLLRGGRLRQITRDQSLAYKLIVAGELSEAQARSYEYANIVLQALGATRETTVDLSFIELRRDDVVMLCSDGLSGLVSVDRLREGLQSATDPMECARGLLESALNEGGSDNATVIVARVHEGAPEADATDHETYEPYVLQNAPQAPTTQPDEAVATVPDLSLLELDAMLSAPPEAPREDEIAAPPAEGLAPEAAPTDAPRGTVIRSDIPARLDALAWSNWHRRVVFALGITWILDGLEASLIANLAPVLQDPRTLGLRVAQIGLANSVYLAGQVLGALVFGHLTDRYGRKRLFLVTLGLYLGATAASGAAPNFAIFLLFRLLAGAGIGGEYSAINSAIDELIPARLRGQVDLGINGSYWIGVALGALLTLVLLDPTRVPVHLGWRLVFGLGAALGLVILLVRREVPESPRWLLMHGFVREADATMALIESRARGSSTRESPGAFAPVEITVTGVVGFDHVAHTLLRRFPARTVLGLTMMVAQAFFYNAIFFSYGLILQRFHHVRAERVGLYILPFAAGNFLGPLLLGPLFDRWGRRVMIPATYAISGVLLVATGALFHAGVLNATTQTLAWCGVFFFASAAASAAYLTVSELFPVEIRGVAIALFYAVGTAGGAIAPAVFARLVEDGNPTRLFAGYAFAAALMLIAAAVARALSVSSEGRSLEDLTR